MSAPEAKIICDSISPNGDRCTTMEVKLHRFVLAELNTHRVFSRNSASSRAIPVMKILERVNHDPAMPVWWGKNQAGMSAKEELSLADSITAQQIWLEARDNAVKAASALTVLGLHKQITNRLLEPWMWHHAIITSTEWTNFFSQRCHPDAQPEMNAAAMAMQLAYFQSTPKLIEYNQWHLPYITDEDWRQIQASDQAPHAWRELKRISVARCARVSYLTHDGVRDIAKDLDLYDKLANAAPMHASPFEHVATPRHDNWSQRGNLKGWDQFRHSFDNESVKTFVPNHPELQQ